jgi:hypothetical protein
MDENHIKITGENPRVLKQISRDDRFTVPLTVYIGGVRRIIGTARVEGDQIEAYIDPKEHVGKALTDLIANDVIRDVSIAFNAPPATPRINPEGQIDWLKNY